MAGKTYDKEEAQEFIDEVYGKNEWEITEFKGGHHRMVAKHKCGLDKEVSRFSTFKLGKTKCKCQRKSGATREVIEQKIKELTYDTYEVLEFTNGEDFVVNHKSCDRKPFKTSSLRFFTRGQRCACSKKGVVGRKPKSEIVTEEE